MKLAKHRGIKKVGLAPVPKGISPWWPMPRWENEFERLFEEPFGGWLTRPEPVFETWLPAVNVYDGKNEFVVKAELPGMKKEEFEVYMSGNNLNIAGERKEEREEKTAETYRTERYFGRFHRSIPLPTPVKAEKIEAHYKDGILTVICPKTEAGKRKDVTVKAE